MSLTKTYFQDINPKSSTCGEIRLESIKSDCTPNCPPEEELETFYKMISSAWVSDSSKQCYFEWLHGYEWGDLEGIYYSLDYYGTTKYKLDMVQGRSELINWTEETYSIYFWAGIKAHDQDEASNLYWDNYNQNHLDYQTRLDDTNKTHFQLVNNVRYNFGTERYIEQNQAQYLYTNDETGTIPIAKRDIWSYVPSIMIQFKIVGQGSYSTYQLNVDDKSTIQPYFRNKDLTQTYYFQSVPVESPVLAKDWVDNFMSDKQLNYELIDDTINIILTK